MGTINSFITIAFILLSCQKNDINVNSNINSDKDTLVIYAYPPELIDLNNDNITDFIIEYMRQGTDDVPQSSSRIFGKIRPENKNKILYESSSGYFFLEKGDTITISTQTNSRWFRYGVDILSISWNINVGWDSTWTILTENVEPYYLALLLNFNQIDQIGWIELSLNSMTGKITINDYFYKESEFIITGHK